MPVVDLRLVVRVGAAADRPVRAGRASLTAEMLDEGTADYGALELADAVESLGASLETRATWDASVVSLHVLKSRLAPALDLLAGVVLQPTFPEREFERVRDERVADLLRQRQEPRFLALEAFSAEVYGADHPYGAPISGTRESVERFGRGDVTAFYEAYYHPANAFLVAAGDVRTEELIATLERSLGGWMPRSDGKVRPPGPPPAKPSTIYVVDKPGSAQSEIRVGHSGAARTTPDYFPLRVMNTVLGGSFTSRLNMTLREERGYTYGAHSGFEFRFGPGPFVAASAVFTDATDSALAVCLDQIRRIRDEPVPEAELQRARNYLAFGLPRRLESTGDLVREISEIELYGLGDDYLEHFTDRVQAVTAADVQRVAREYLDPERLAFVVVGDRARIEERLHRLNVAPVVVR